MGGGGGGKAPRREGKLLSSYSNDSSLVVFFWFVKCVPSVVFSQIFFESFNVPALYISMQAVLSL